MSVNELLFGQYPKFNRQIYVASSTYKQAQTIFKMASQQVNLMRSKSKFIREKTDVRKTDIEDVLSSSVFAPLSNNPDAVMVKILQLLFWTNWQVCLMMRCTQGLKQV